MAKLYFIYSAMNAGKSTILLQAAYNYRERGMRTALFTASHYAELEDGRISSRLGGSAEAELFDADHDMFDWIRRLNEQAQPVSCVFIDEAQFLTRAQVWQLARVADRLGVPVMCYGLRTDFRGQLFEGAAELLAIADDLREVRTICHCGRKATMVLRKDAQGATTLEGETVQVEKDVYVSLCRMHWEEETGRWPLA